MTKAPFSDSIGQTLANRRAKKGLSLAECAELLGVNPAVLTRLEADDYDYLPHDIYSLGLVRRYSRLLRLDEEVAAQKYLFLRGDLPKQATTLKRMKTKRAIVTAQWTGWLAAGLAVAAVAAYLVTQLLILTSPPQLTLVEPAEDRLVTAVELTVRGRTLPSAEVSVNGVGVITDDEGWFSTQISLHEGLNQIEIKAVNRRGQETAIVRNMVYDPGE